MTRADSGADSVTEKRKDNNTEAARRAFTIKTILIMNIDLQLQLKSIYQRRIVYCRYLYRRTLGMVKKYRESNEIFWEALQGKKL